MEGMAVDAVLAGKKSSFLANDGEEKDAMAMASSASPAAIFLAFLAPLLSLLRQVACLCAGYLLGLDGGLKPSAPAPASSSSSSSSAAAAACQRDEVEAAASEDCTEMEVLLEVRPRGSFMPPPKPRSTPVQSRRGAVGGDHH